jgi:hypothetical protein
MAITNWNNFIAAGVQQPWYATALEDALKGYKMQREPTKIAAEEKKNQLANEMKKIELDAKPGQLDVEKRYKEALTSAANAQAENYKKPAGLKGALATAFQLRNNLDPQSPTYEKDVNSINNYINNLGQKNGAIPMTQPGEGIKINLPEGKEGFIPGVGKLKAGWQSVKDAKGNDIGVNVPMTDKQVDQWKAKEKFDVIYPFINKALGEYTGQNSWENFSRDAKDYNRDPAAKERIDSFLAAKKLISIASTTENARIGGHATNIQLDELKKTLDSSEVNKKLVLLR